MFTDKTPKRKVARSNRVANRVHKALEIRQKCFVSNAFVIYFVILLNLRLLTASRQDFPVNLEFMAVLRKAACEGHWG